MPVSGLPSNHNGGLFFGLLGSYCISFCSRDKALLQNCAAEVYICMARHGADKLQPCLLKYAVIGPGISNPTKLVFRMAISATEDVDSHGLNEIRNLTLKTHASHALGSMDVCSRLPC